MFSKIRKLAIKAKTNHGYTLSTRMIAEIESLEVGFANLGLAFDNRGDHNQELIESLYRANCNVELAEKAKILTRIKWVFTGVKIK